MSDLKSMAVSIVQLLLPYLVKIGEGSAKTIGERLPEGVFKIYSLVKKKIYGNEEAMRNWKNCLSYPESEYCIKRFLERYLAKELMEDVDFRQRVEVFLNEHGNAGKAHQRIRIDTMQDSEVNQRDYDGSDNAMREVHQSIQIGTMRNSKVNQISAGKGGKK